MSPDTRHHDEPTADQITPPEVRAIRHRRQAEAERHARNVTARKTRREKE